MYEYLRDFFSDGGVVGRVFSDTRGNYLVFGHRVKDKRMF